MNKGAADTGFTVNETVPPAAEAEFAKLSKMSGAEFDDEFVAYMISANQHDIALFQEAAKSQNPTVAQSAKNALPTLEKHLKMAQALKGPAPASAGNAAN
jgi:putative membrane protein